MEFSLTISLRSNLRDSPRTALYDLYGGLMADEWAQQAAKQFKQGEDAFDSKTDRARQEREILVQQAPQLWQDLRQWIQWQIEPFNRAAGKEVLTAPLTQANKLQIFAKSDRGQREASVVFNEASHSVSCEVRQTNTAYQPINLPYKMRVTQQNSLVLVNVGGYEIPPQDAGKEILDRLLSWS